jgi:hypothetical protein
MHPYNSINKDLNLRGTTAFKSPERLPEITPVHGSYSLFIINKNKIYYQT